MAQRVLRAAVLVSRPNQQRPKEVFAMKKLVVLFVSVAVLAVSISPRSSAQQTQPGKETSVPLKGLKAEVVIRRDERGIPYINAKNDEDLYFAQGYATAQDRLWQMDLFRRNARGE